MNAPTIRMPAAIGVTGGVASGKSEVARRFEALGIEVIDADMVAREMVLPGRPALSEIAARFGAALLDASGQLDRAALRRVVFNDPVARGMLESILHPRIRTAMHERASHASGAYVLLAIPLLVESAHYDWLHRVLLVDVPEALQIERVMRRDGIDGNAAASMLAAQTSRVQRLAVADDVIINDADFAHLDSIVARLDRRYRDLLEPSGRNQLFREHRGSSGHHENVIM